MRALHVAYEHPPAVLGGLGRHVAGVADELVGCGVETTVACAALDASHPSDGEAHGRQVVVRAAADRPRPPDERWMARFHAAESDIMAAAGAHVAGGWRPDVVHAHDWIVARAGVGLAEALGVPLVATVHATERIRHQGHLPNADSAAIDATERWLVQRADRVVVASRHMAERVTADLGCDPDRLVVVSNGVEPVFGEPADPPTGLPGGDGQLVATAARLEYEKGVHVLLEAMALLRTWPAAGLAVAGDGNAADWLRRHAADLGLDGRVAFLGHLDRRALVGLYRAADVVVVPSLEEPSGLVALEAQRAGAPVVASRVGGLVETVRDDETGLLVDRDDAADLADAVDRLLGDRGLASKLAEQGQRQAAERSWRAAAERIAACYREVVTA